MKSLVLKYLSITLCIASIIVLFLDQYVSIYGAYRATFTLWDIDYSYGLVAMILAVTTEVVVVFMSIIEFFDITTDGKGLNKVYAAMHYIAILGILLSVATLVWQIAVATQYGLHLKLYAIIMFLCSLSSAICTLIDAKLRK